ncbi:sigma-70 family RNA polymerase sigma factor [Roseiconus lacunae]|uniref:Sigma-70 family RNA polymerase sigma factor n=1 Tax=Roseiconus lacunae TaxID=2605694 RepID=A0ABT7PRQ3_9BACT|nr:sigma-70 family RNA polymerase sigma factor [Roseiconus lacunae]MCD0457953.1 sigma-70 family RNA polymerase sigma factor [Roseiconus lacunae]MDM4019182.1 sigma-70 family RNA polymerase sigma factor [Roseiconus lacunae]WRQ48412.1 sigma-70 family RNA polymerase sigma factor [Stieleria sp. HD01]
MDSEISRILSNLEQGDPAAASELLPLVYEELRRLASSRMRRENAAQTLQPTALVHEAYLRLIGREHVRWDGKSHFFAAAAEAMRRILIEHARRRNTLKRGGDRQRFEIDRSDGVVNVENADELLDLDAALTQLAVDEPELAKLVELRYFAGLSVEEAAEVLAMSPRSVKRHWAYARVWLARAMDVDK